MAMNRPAGSGGRLSRVERGVSLLVLAAAAASFLPTSADAALGVTPLYGHHMVLQRDQAVPVWGTAAPGATVTVTYNSRTNSAVADARGNWRVTLAAMAARTNGGTFSIVESGGGTLSFTNVVVGDVWVCSGQSNMAMGLGSCNRPADVAAASFPGIRHFWVPLVTSGEPAKSLTGNWTVCSPATAGGFSAVAFYFGRKIYQDQSAGIPIGLIASTVGGTCIDPWLAPEGLTDIPVIQPLYSQSILPWGPFSLFNGMIYPLAPYPAKGAIWYQGENRETTSQSADSYYLKEKALLQGWKRLWGADDFALYLVLLANYGTAAATVTPDGAGSWADTRQMQTMAMALPHAGVASALDVGEAADIHPKDKLDVGERLALWALKNDYGRTNLVTSGPILRDVTVGGTNLICSFDYVGAGLMVGSKTSYPPTIEVTNGTLTRFSIAGAAGSWYAGNAVISGSTVVVSSPSVASPRRVAYAYWQNPEGANLYNRDGLPAAPFYVDDANAKHTVTATAGAGGTISPSGVTTYLKRMTALYTFAPDPGYFISNVVVDGVSVGSPKAYTFDPLYASHTITAAFAASAPTYTLAAAAAPGGAISPAGTTTVAQGGAQLFSIVPSPGCLTSVSVDGFPVGARSNVVFGDVRANHTLSAVFSCTINASSGYGGTISPNGLSTVAYGTNKTFTFAPSAGFSILKVMVDGTNIGAVSSYTFTNVVTSHSLSVSFAGSTGGGSVPQQGQILFACLTDTLPTGGVISSWSTYVPSGQSLSTIGNPTATTIDGRKFAHNVYGDYDGFSQGAYASPIACTGATIVAVAKPTRFGVDGNWQSIVDIFYDRLVLGLMNGSGRICVRRNSSLDTSTAVVPEGQTTILSLVVQSNGAYKVYANGTEALNITSTSVMTSLVPAVAGPFADRITVGRNWPDGWTTFNGEIGDIFVYKTALGDADRVALETYLVNRLAGSVGTNYTITASAGPGGSISPSGAVQVAEGANQPFGIAPLAGYGITGVTVDSVSKGAIAAYTFTNVTANHTIAAGFGALPTYAVAGRVTSATGTAIAGATVCFAATPNASANPIFTALTDAGGNFSRAVYTGLWFVAAAAAGFFTSADRTVAVSGAAATNVNFVLQSTPGTIVPPATNQLLFSVVTDVFPATNGVPTGNWATYMPSGQTLAIKGTPTVEILDGVKWEKNVYADGDGYRQGRYATPLACSGMTFVAAVRPAYVAVAGEPRGEIVDIFYDRLALAVSHADGRIMVARGAWNDWGPAIPDGQKTILSLVVQTNGSYRVYTNGTACMTGGAQGAWTSIDPVHSEWSDPDFTHYINVGRNEPDGWSIFNGNIGDVFVYTAALSDAERQQLEAALMAKFIAAPPLAGYPGWAAGYALTGSGADDQDHDGYANLWEYTTGSNPTDPQSWAAMSGSLTDGCLRVHFARNVSASDVTIRVEGAGSITDQVPWTVSSTFAAGGWGSDARVAEAVTGAVAAVTVRDLTNGAPQRAMRLTVSQP